MKFHRRPRLEPITITARKAAAFQRRQERERNALPLFSELVAASQPSIDGEEARRNAIAARIEQERRDMEAKWWRQHRHDFFRASPQVQEQIRIMWAGWAGPRTPIYYGYVVDVCTGEFERRSQAAKERDRAIFINARAARGVQLSLEQLHP